MKPPVKINFVSVVINGIKFTQAGKEINSTIKEEK